MFPIILISSLIFSLNFSQKNYQIVLDDASRLLINGQANITDYTCELNQTFSLKSLNISTLRTAQSINTDSAKLELLVKNFDCGIAKMNSDFQESMKADSYPLMTLKLNQIYLNKVDLKSKLNDLEANVQVTIANVSNYYDINFVHYKRSDGFHVVKGSHQMLMTDFKIVPPTALFGLIKVYGNIEIEFELIFKIKEITKPSK